jgi:hypothetical protein
MLFSCGVPGWIRTVEHTRYLTFILKSLHKLKQIVEYNHDILEVNLEYSIYDYMNLSVYLFLLSFLIDLL